MSRSVVEEWPWGGLIVLDQSEASSLPLRRTEVHARILGPLAAVQVTQHFQNPFAQPVNLEYLFPLPEGGAIHDFEFVIGEEHVKAEIQASEVARERYEEARIHGRRATLFEERRPNLFALLLANVQPGDEIEACIRYQQQLLFRGANYEFVFPMGITPRYHRHPEDAEATDTARVLPGEEIGQVTLTVELDAGEAALDPVSPSHPLEVRRLNERSFAVQLAGEHIPDKDFVLRYQLRNPEIQTPVWVSGEQDTATVLVTLVPNGWPEPMSAPPREFIFVLDRSGSMAGAALRQAANALSAGLRTLRAEDTFYLLAFDDRLDHFTRRPVPFVQEQLEAADRWLERIDARGGTEIGKALEAALALPADAMRQRHIIFFTDGAVSAERDVLTMVRRGLHNARLFAFGIGPSVNRAFISSLARLGRGTSEFLQLDEDIEAAIIRFHDRLAYPLLQQLEVSWQGTTAWDMLPAALPDIYYGDPLLFCARIRPAPGSHLLLSGKSGTQRWERSIPLPAPASHDEMIQRIWAKGRIDALEEQLQAEPRQAGHLRDEIIGLALEHHLLTAYTSLVAVKAGEVSQQEAHSLRVAVPLPQGLEEHGFLSGLMPQSVMPSMACRIMTNLEYHKAETDDSALGCDSEIPMQPAPQDNFILALARRQKANGSWGPAGAELEWTCAAVLAFVRAGNSLVSGSYRRILEKAVTWLLAHPGSSMSDRRMRAIVLLEMKRAGDHPLLVDLGATEAAAAHGLPEVASSGKVGTPHELRLAALNGCAVEVDLRPEEGSISRIWLEALPRG